MQLKAKSLIEGYNFEEIVYPADYIIKKIDSRAKFYSVHKGYSYFYIPAEGEPDDWCYLINGEKYLSIGTNDRKELEKFYANDDKPYQMNLFEQCE